MKDDLPSAMCHRRQESKIGIISRNLWLLVKTALAVRDIGCQVWMLRILNLPQNHPVSGTVVMRAVLCPRVRESREGSRVSATGTTSSLPNVVLPSRSR